MGNTMALIMVVVLIAFQNFIAKQYSLKKDGFNILIFSGMTTMGALLFFVINARFHIEFIPALLPYSLGFAFCFGIAAVGCTMAIRSGMFSISTLVTSYSLIIPTFYGILFLGDKIGFIGYIGLMLLFTSIYLLNKTKETFEVSLSWVIWILIAFWGDGLCSTIQKMQQLHFNGLYKNLLMIYALIILSIGFLTAGLLTAKNKKNGFRHATYYGVLRGVANGVVNFLVMVLTGVMPNALLFPMISAGGIVVSFILATVLYREQLTKPQIIGYITGTISIILLNL